MCLGLLGSGPWEELQRPSFLFHIMSTRGPFRSLFFPPLRFFRGKGRSDTVYIIMVIEIVL